jgi:hypothetical protein
VRLEGLGQLKNPVTSLGLELPTIRLIALCLRPQRYPKLGTWYTDLCNYRKYSIVIYVRNLQTKPKLKLLMGKMKIKLSLYLNTDTRGRTEVEVDSRNTQLSLERNYAVPLQFHISRNCRYKFGGLKRRGVSLHQSLDRSSCSRPFCSVPRSCISDQ